MIRKTQLGFTLIELLIVVAIIGIIAAIAIPNLLNAINRGRQKRTMADIRSVATAIESYSVDNNFYPAVGSGWGSQPLEELGPYVIPTYIRTLPNFDGWNHAFWFRSGAAPGYAGPHHYWIESFGKDGQDAMDPTSPVQTTSFNDDIIWMDGAFISWPEGMQIE